MLWSCVKAELLVDLFQQVCLSRLMRGCALQLDDGSSHPGEHTLEKLTAGRYLGDVVRRILLR